MRALQGTPVHCSMVDTSRCHGGWSFHAAHVESALGLELLLFDWMGILVLCVVDVGSLLLPMESGFTGDELDKSSCKSSNGLDMARLDIAVLVFAIPALS